MPDPFRPDDRPLLLWLVVRLPGDEVVWVEADRVECLGLHVELVVDIEFLGRSRSVVERRLVASEVLVVEPVSEDVPWRPHRW